jgi:exportin-1
LSSPSGSYFISLHIWLIFSPGDIATKTPKVRGLRTIKREILKLIDTYVQKADDLEMVNANMVPPLLEAVLVDYNRNVPNAREAEVLNAMTTVIQKLHVRHNPLKPAYLLLALVLLCTC